MIQKRSNLGSDDSDDSLSESFNQMLKEADEAERAGRDEGAYFLLSEIIDSPSFSSHQKAVALLHRSFIYYKLELFVASENDLHQAKQLGDISLAPTFLEIQRKKILYSSGE